MINAGEPIDAADPGTSGGQEHEARSERGWSSQGTASTNSPTRESMIAIAGLSLVGFFVNCQPSEPFLTRFLLEDKGLTEAELDNQVWPYDTYGSFLFLIPVGVLAESYGYRRVIFFGLLCREATRILLLFTNGVGLMAVMQLTYAAATCANTVYYAYGYMVVGPADFHVATGFVRASYHFGNVIGAILGQLLVDNGVELRVLFYLSWGFTTLGLISFALFLPSPTREAPPSLASLLLNPIPVNPTSTDSKHASVDDYVGQERSDNQTASLETKNRGLKDCGNRWKLVFKELNRLYTGRTLIQWSVWWLIMYSVNQMILNYYQTQLYEIDENTKFGYIEASMEAFAVAGAVSALRSPVSLTKGFSSALIFAASAAVGVSYLIATVLADAQNLFGVAALNIIPAGIYGFMITVASATIAAEALTPRYAVIFTVNTFFSFGISTVIQQAAASSATSTKGYYVIAAVMCFILSVYAVLSSIYYRMRRGEEKATTGEGGPENRDLEGAFIGRYRELDEPEVNNSHSLPEEARNTRNVRTGADTKTNIAANRERSISRTDRSEVQPLLERQGVRYVAAKVRINKYSGKVAEEWKLLSNVITPKQSYFSRLLPPAYYGATHRNKRR